MFKGYEQLNLDLGVDATDLKFSSLENKIVPITKNKPKDLVSKVFEDKEIRIIFDETTNQYWFVLKDVLNALGTSTRPADAKASISQALRGGVVSVYPLMTAGGVQRRETGIVEQPPSDLA